jgi:hypothetical protein
MTDLTVGISAPVTWGEPEQVNPKNVLVEGDRLPVDEISSPRSWQRSIRGWEGVAADTPVGEAVRHRSDPGRWPHITPGLQPARGHPRPDGVGGHRGGARPGAGRKPGVPNKTTQTFREVLLRAVSEVGDSREEGKDGQGGLLGYLKKAAVREEKTTLVLLGRILPLKISAEVKQIKEKMTIQEAVADLKALGMDELLAFYLKRYPIERDEEDAEWANMIDGSLVEDPPVDVTPQKDDTASRMLCPNCRAVTTSPCHRPDCPLRENECE